MLVVACQPAPPTATRPPATQPPLFITVVVTRTPLPTATLTPTPTLPYDITAANGTWNVNMVFTLRGHQSFREVRFVGLAQINVDLTGQVTGSAEFYPSLNTPRCVSAVLDSDPLRAQVSGALRPDENGSPAEPILDLSLVPADPLQRTALRLQCPGFEEVYDVSEPLLWPALEAAGQLAFSLTLRAGFRESRVTDLIGPTAGGIRGALVSEIDVSR